MGVAADVARVEPNPLHQLGDAALAAAAVPAPGPERLGDQVHHRHAGVQGGVRVLEDHLHVAARLHDLAALEPSQVDHLSVAAPEQDAARGRVESAQYQAPGGGLAAAALPDQPQGVARVEAEADAVDPPDRSRDPAQQPPPHREVLAMARPHRGAPRHLPFADLPHLLPAAGVEGASGRQRMGAGNAPLDRLELFRPGREVGYRAQQGRGVRVRRGIEDPLDRALLDDAAEVRSRSRAAVYGIMRRRIPPEERTT